MTTSVDGEGLNPPSDDNGFAHWNLDRGGVPDLIAEAILDGEIKRTEAWREYVTRRDQGSRIIVLSGGVGCGKTWAACAAIGHFGPSSIPDGAGGTRCGVRLIAANALARACRANRTLDPPFGEELLLVVDDLGAEVRDTWGGFLAGLGELLEYRLMRGNVTLLTTNLGPEEFREAYGERLADRINGEQGFVRLAGESLRTP